MWRLTSTPTHLLLPTGRALRNFDYVKRTLVVLLFVFVPALAPAATFATAPSAILDIHSYWRSHITFRPVAWGTTSAETREEEGQPHTPPPPADWMKPIIAGAGTGQVGRIAKAAAHRLWVDKVWDLRSRPPADSPTRTLQAPLNGQAASMPIWIEVPDSTSRYLLVEGSQHWLDGAGEPIPAVITAGELANDKAIADAAARFDKRVAAIESLLCRELGIRSDHVLRLPVLHIDNGRGGDAWCLTPNPVNLLNLEGLVIVLKTFGPRTNPADDSTDVLAHAIRTALAPRDVRFLDGWDALHRDNGGPRCGTNVLRR